MNAIIDNVPGIVGLTVPAVIGMRLEEIQTPALMGGAIGFCCQKVSEAEAIVAGRIGDVLITNQVVAPLKIDRLAQLTAKARVPAEWSLQHKALGLTL